MCLCKLPTICNQSLYLKLLLQSVGVFPFQTYSDAISITRTFSLFMVTGNCPYSKSHVEMGKLETGGKKSRLWVLVERGCNGTQKLGLERAWGLMRGSKMEQWPMAGASSLQVLPSVFTYSVSHFCWLFLENRVWAFMKAEETNTGLFVLHIKSPCFGPEHPRFKPSPTQVGKDWVYKWAGCSWGAVVGKDSWRGSITHRASNTIIKILIVGVHLSNFQF